MKRLRLRCRGVSYNLQPVLLVKGTIRPYSQPVFTESTNTAVQVLRYRGVPYLREVCLVPVSGMEAQVAPLPKDLSKDNVDQKAIDRESAVQTETLGFSYWLYCKGWRQGSLHHLSPVQHRLLSLFLHYRKGYATGFQWRQHYLESLRSSK